MIEGARALESAGCEALAVACNTAHHWADELRAAVRIPLLHIAEVAVEALSERSPRPDTVGLLATRGTLQSGFYQRALEVRGFRVQWPDDREQVEGIDAAIRQVKVNRASDGRPLFEGVAQAMLDRGCGVLMLACTELPLLLPGSSMARHCIDTNETLARAIVKEAFRRVMLDR
jgi:aspartate racemase